MRKARYFSLNQTKVLGEENSEEQNARQRGQSALQENEMECCEDLGTRIDEKGFQI